MNGRAPDWASSGTSLVGVPMAASSVFFGEANRWNVAKFMLGIVCAMSLVRVGLALAVLSNIATFPESFPRVTDRPVATLALNGFWAIACALLFWVVERRRRRVVGR